MVLEVLLLFLLLLYFLSQSLNVLSCPYFLFSQTVSWLLSLTWLQRGVGLSLQADNLRTISVGVFLAMACWTAAGCQRSHCCLTPSVLHLITRPCHRHGHIYNVWLHRVSVSPLFHTSPLHFLCDSWKSRLFNVITGNTFRCLNVNTVLILFVKKKAFLSFCSSVWSRLYIFFFFFAIIEKKLLIVKELSWDTHTHTNEFPQCLTLV